MPKQENLENPKSSFWFSPGAKFIITGIITLLLLVPTLMVWGLVEERADRAQDTASSIAKGWGGEQTINGPYLVVPYSMTAELLRPNKLGKKVVATREFAIFSPSESKHEANIEVEERKKSIYSLPVYHMKSNISGKFDAVDLKSIKHDIDMIDLDPPFLVMGVADSTGFRSQVLAKLNNGLSIPFEPGTKQLGTKSNYKGYNKYKAKHASGIHLPISKFNLNNGFEFEIDLALNGSRSFSLVPNGKSTSLEIKSNWPHPGFDGQFLPETRDISDNGFSANWTIPNLARGIDAVFVSSDLPNSSSIVVNFVEPLKFYQLVSRSLKYSIAFLSLIFLAVFILELMGKKAVHWIQYILVGLAMIVFYILLLALAEHIGFTIAYISSAIASTLLISWYVGTSLGQKNGMAIMIVILGLIYAVVFLVLKEAEYALLAGALIAFFAIAVTMYATRKVDWSSGPLSTDVKS